MFKSFVGPTALLFLSVGASAQSDRPCEQLAGEMLLGEWDNDQFVNLGGEIHHLQWVSKGEVVAPGQVKFEATPNVYLITTYRHAGGTLKTVNEKGESLAPPSEIAIPVCGKNPDTGAYYWVEEGRTGPAPGVQYRKEYYAGSEMIIEIINIKTPLKGNDSDFFVAGSIHMTRKKTGVD